MRFFSTIVASAIGTVIALACLFVFFFLFLIAVASLGDTEPTVRSRSVLVMNLSGNIPEMVSGDPIAQTLLDEPSVDLLDVKRALKMAAADDRIEALWIRPRGVQLPWAVAEEVRRSLEQFKASGKPIIASTDDYYTAEDEYYLASVADSIFSAPEAICEFNGFFVGAQFYKRLMDRLDVDAQVIRSGKYKSAVEPFELESMSNENEVQLQAILATWEGAFLDAVSDSRDIDAGTLARLMRTKAIVTAKDALEAGLIDALRYPDEVESSVKDAIGVEADDDLNTISLTAYSKSRPSSAGIREGSDGEVAIVLANGTITTGKTDTTPVSGGDVGAESFSREMKRVRDRDDVKAVVLRINSPGGFAPAADAMYRAVALTAAEKPVVVSMGDLAASGGYWLAMAADTIVANPSTLTGSIGVFSLFLDVGGLLEDKIGITTDILTTSPFADMYTGLRPFTQAEVAVMQSSVDETYARFLQVVADNRNMTTEDVDLVAQGRVWSGTDAREVGLVDVLGGVDTAVEIAAEMAGLEEGSYRTRAYPRPPTFFETLSQSLDTRVAAIRMRVSTSSAERRLLEQARWFGEMLRDHATVQARMPYAFTRR